MAAGEGYLRPRRNKDPDIQDAGRPRLVYDRMVHHGGHVFLVTTEMAGIFAGKVRLLRDANDTQLVPLPHRGGIELLLISPGTLCVVVAVETGLEWHL